MPTEVILPKVDMDMTVGRISRWFVPELGSVKKGDALFEIETDKAAMEVEAPASGTLRNVVGKEGVDIPVGQAVAWIYADGEAVGETSEERALAGESRKSVVTLASQETREPASVALSLPNAGNDLALRDRSVRPRATPLARRMAQRSAIDLSALIGSGPKGRVQAKDIERATAERLAAKRPEAIDLRPVRAPSASEPAASAMAAPRESHTVASRAGTPVSSTASIWLREAGDGVPLVLIHGFGSETAGWRPFLAAYRRSIPILAVDLPGHGAAVDVAVQGFDDLVAHVEGELSNQGIKAAHLAGHSLGGAVATAVAAGIGIETKSLLLLAPAGFGPAINTDFTRGFAAAQDEDSVRRWMAELVSDRSILSNSLINATLRARRDGRLSDAQTRLAVRLFSEGTQHFSVRSLLDHLVMPIKIIVGAADRVIPPVQVQGLPGHVGLHTFPGLGHMPQLEARDVVARLLDELIAAC